MISNLKRILLPFVLTLLAIFIQASILRVWLPPAFLPALVVIIVVYLGFHEVNLLGVWLSFFVGLLFDSSSGMMLGPWATASVGLFGILGAVSRRVFLDSVVSGIIITGISALFSLLIYTLLATQFRSAIGFNIAAITGSSFSTALLSPLGFALIKWSYRRFGLRG